MSIVTKEHFSKNDAVFIQIVLKIIKVTNVYTFIETTTSTTIAPTTKTAGIYVFLLHNSSH